MQRDSPSYASNALGSKRTRISRACDVCRRKKIKCDVDGDNSCTTCHQYNWECTFTDTAKKRGPPKGYIESLETRLKKMESMLEKIQPETSKSKAQPPIPVSTENNSTRSAASSSSASASSTTATSPVQMPTSVEHSKVVRYLGSSSGYYLVRDILGSNGDEGGEKMTPAAITAAAAAANSQRRSSIIQTEQHGPIRFRKINVDDDDVLFVRDKTLEEHVDQLQTDRKDLDESIASKAVIDDLVRRFFEIDFVSLPLMDKDEFMNGYEGRVDPPPAPILTYAICSYACIMIPLNDPIFEKHNVDRIRLFDTLVEHTSYLLRKEYLTPRIATIQALVLLYSYRPCDNSFYRNWLRTGMSVRMAQELGLHRSLEKVPLSEAQVESNKRLWYCVYVSDRWSSALTGRPLAIADTDCDIELPQVRRDGESNDYSVFINFIKLSGILGEVLRRIYSPRAKSQGYNTVQSYHTVQSIYCMLNDWLKSIPDQQRISPEEARSTYGATILSTKVKEAGPLMTCYYVVVILLYRSFLVSDPNDVYPQLYKESSERCTDAAKSVVDIARLISPFEIVRFGWNFSGYAVFQASLIHVYNCTSSVPEVADTARKYIHTCIRECIEPLSDEMPHGPQAIPLIQTLMSLIGVDIDKEQLDPIHNANGYAVPSTSGYTTNVNTATSINPSPMSVQTIVSDWNNEPPKADAASAAAWQCLFSSAATPFFENEADWQATLASLFDETTQ